MVHTVSHDSKLFDTTKRCMSLDKYKCHKEVLATPMTRQEYNNYRGWELPSDEDGSDEGFLVEYLDGGESNHELHDGYISWSPKAVFERGYTKVNG